MLKRDANNKCVCVSCYNFQIIDIFIVLWPHFTTKGKTNGIELGGYFITNDTLEVASQKPMSTQGMRNPPYCHAAQ